MNERIEQLSNEAINCIPDGVDFDIPDVFKEKLSELIVKECLNQCYNRGMNDELYAGQLKAAEYIEEHFGIEK